MLRQLLAFLRKDFLIESSYKLSFLMSLVSAFTGLGIFYFTGRLFGEALSPYLTAYNTSYFGYVFAATAFFSYIGTGAGSYSERLRAEQLQGTLEAALCTPLKPAAFLAALTGWNFVFASFELLIYLLAGVFLFKLDFSNANFPALTLIFILSIISFAALGILSSCFVLLFKRGNPLAWVLNNAEGLLGGVYFPIAVLPLWLQWPAKLLPISYAIRAMELSLYKGEGIYELRHEILALTFFSSALLPLSIAAFKSSLKTARKNGNLSGY